MSHRDQNPDRPRALIVGGSMAGLFAAIFLRRRGWRVDVFERAHGLADRGAGIVTHPPLFDSLRAAGLQLHHHMGVRSTGRTLLGPDGAVVGTHEEPQVLTSWGLIHRFLREQLPEECSHLGVSIEGVEPRRTHCDATDSDGVRHRADWVIAADGTHSTVRHRVAPEIRPEYCGYFIWRGLVDERRLSRGALNVLDGRMTFGMAPGGHWLGYVVAGPSDELDPGRRRYNWGWYRTADEAVLRDVLTDDAGVHHAHGIPHHRIRPGLRDAMRADAGRLLAPQIREVVEATDAPFIQPIFEVTSARLVHERVILIGDAACTARPHVGMGVTKAAQDASTLAAALSGDAATIEAALTAWEETRLRAGRAIVGWGRDLGSALGPPPQDEHARRKAEHFQRPDVLLSMTAASDPAAYGVA